MDTSTKASNGKDDQAFCDDTKLPGTAPADDTKLPGTAPAEDRSFGDDTKLPGTAPLHG